MSFTIKKKLQETTNDRRKELDRRVSRGTVAALTDVGQLLPKMKIELRAISTLRKANRRARRGATAQITRIKRSLAEFRQVVPIVIDDKGAIIDGHNVVEALRELGSKDVWCVVADHLDEDEAKLLHVTLNRLGETGEWDMEALGSLLIELDEIDYDLEITGFSLPEIDILTHQTDGDGDDAESGKADEVPPLPGSWPRQSLPTARGTFRSRASSAVLARKSTRTSRWALVRCRPSSSRSLPTRFRATARMR
jgi:hypothetical protein